MTNNRKRTRMVKRRGRRKNLCKSVTNLIVMHSNCRGLKSKIQSVNHTVNNLVKPDILSLNEHGIRGKNKIKIDNFHSFNKNRVNKTMGGVSISVPEDKLSNFMKVKEGEGTDEYVIVRCDDFTPPINFVSLYGTNECRVSKEIINESWQRILLDLKKIEMRKEHVIIASDINRKLGNDDLGIVGNNSDVSFGGALVRDLIATGRYICLS